MYKLITLKIELIINCLSVECILIYIMECFEHPNHNILNVSDCDSDCDSDNFNAILEHKQLYDQYKKNWTKFANLCDLNDILARSDWACCNTCGSTEIFTERDDIEKHSNKCYLGYVFYHDQTKDNIHNQCKRICDGESDKRDISILLNWGYFNEKDDAKDNMCIALASKIQRIALDANCGLTYTDINKKLNLIVSITE